METITPFDCEYLLDTTVFIDHLNGVAEAMQFLSAHGSVCCVSFITVAETLAGASEPELEQTRALLESFPLLSPDFELAAEAARLRALERWKLPDALQAAFALRFGLKLVTRNTRDFPPDKYPFVHVPYG